MIRRKQTNVFGHLGTLFFTFLFFVFGSMAGANLVHGQDGSQPPSTTDETAVPSVNPAFEKNLSSAQKTMRNFLKTVNDPDSTIDIGIFLDMSDMDPATVQSKKNDIGFKIKGVIDRMWRVDFDLIDDDTDAFDEFNLSNFAVDLTNSKDVADASNIRISQSDDGYWRFSKTTVAKIEDLWVRWEMRAPVSGLTTAKSRATFSMWLESHFPPTMRKTIFLMPNWHWISLCVVVMVGFILDFATRFFLKSTTTAWFRYFKATADVEMPKNLWKPIGLFVQAATWYFGADLIGFRPEVLSVLTVTLKLFTVFAAVWTAFRIIDLLVLFLLKKAGHSDTKFDDLLVPLVGKSLKTIASCIGIILFVDVFNLEWRAILGGFGIGGAAIAFASKDVIGNFFGSLTVLTDRPFEIGDWVITEGAEGSVESVGIRSSRIRTFYNSIVVVPNSRLTTAIVDNMGQRQYRRIKTMLGVSYNTTPEQIEAFCEGVRELIRRHPYTRKDYFHVYLNDMAESSLNILLYCFIECPDWSVELREKQRLYLDIMRLAQDLKVEFAFPTQTLHVHQSEAARVSDVASSGDPLNLGQQSAAKIAGPLQNKQDRPGPVLFD